MNSVIDHQNRRIINPKQQEGRDSLGFGRITEGQMREFLKIVKSRNYLDAVKPPEDAQGKGIVIAAGGKYSAYGFVNAKWIRSRGVQHPIQIWHFPREYTEDQKKLFKDLDVEFVDAFEVRRKYWHRNLKSWYVKQYSMMRCPFEECVFYDADCFSACDPDVVWDDPEYQKAGALFFSDVQRCRKDDWPYFNAAVRTPDKEMESGVFFWNRAKAWNGIRMTVWLEEHAECFDRSIHGDKDFPYLGFKTIEQPFIQSTESRWSGDGIEQSYKGRVIANHSMSHKRGEHPPHHPLIPQFFEEWRRLSSTV